MTLHRTTRSTIEKWAKTCHIDLDKLKLDAIPDENENMVEITVIFGGALDETFYMDSLYAVSVADLLTVGCIEEARRTDPPESWEIIVTEYAYEDAGSQVYRVSSYDELPGEYDPESNTWDDSRVKPPVVDQ